MYTIPTQPGQSGCPLIKTVNGNEYAVGIHLGSLKKGKRNVALILNKERRERINQMISYLTGTMNLSKLSCDLDGRKIENSLLKELTKEEWCIKIRSLYLEQAGMCDEGMELLSKGDWIHLENLSLSIYLIILGSNPIGDQ